MDFIKFSSLVKYCKLSNELFSLFPSIWSTVKSLLPLKASITNLCTFIVLFLIVNCKYPLLLKVPFISLHLSFNSL